MGATAVPRVAAAARKKRRTLAQKRAAYKERRLQVSAALRSSAGDFLRASRETVPDADQEEQGAALPASLAAGAKGPGELRMSIVAEYVEQSLAKPNVASNSLWRFKVGTPRFVLSEQRCLAALHPGVVAVLACATAVTRPCMQVHDQALQLIMREMHACSDVLAAIRHEYIRWMRNLRRKMPRKHSRRVRILGRVARSARRARRERRKARDVADREAAQHAAERGDAPDAMRPPPPQTSQWDYAQALNASPRAMAWLQYQQELEAQGLATGNGDEASSEDGGQSSNSDADSVAWDNAHSAARRNGDDGNNANFAELLPHDVKGEVPLVDAEHLPRWVDALVSRALSHLQFQSPGHGRFASVRSRQRSTPPTARQQPVVHVPHVGGRMNISPSIDSALSQPHTARSGAESSSDAADTPPPTAAWHTHREENAPGWVANSGGGGGVQSVPRPGDQAVKHAQQAYERSSRPASASSCTAQRSTSEHPGLTFAKLQSLPDTPPSQSRLPGPTTAGAHR